MLKGQQDTKNVLRYVNYSPTVKEIDAILVNLRETDKGGNKGNIYGPRHLEMDDYVSIGLSFIFKILSSVEAEGRPSTRENQSPFGEKGSEKYREILMEIVGEFFSCKNLKEK